MQELRRIETHILMRFALFIATFTSFYQIEARQNGVGRTPPLGWMSWTRFGCKVDCNAEQNDCISERLIVETADRLVADGYLDAGWEYLVIDDCWASKSRDANNDLQPDPVRFPHGIKWLSDYVHSKGLKFGIYAGFGEKTCMGYPGTMHFVERDIAKFVEWEVDYLKLDACYSDPRIHEKGFAQFGARLFEATKFAAAEPGETNRQPGRPIYFSCSYPFYMLLNRLNTIRPDVLLETCNSWRIFDDVALKSDSIWRISEFWAADRLGMSAWSGPGHFNDADMLLIGNNEITPGEARVQLAIWIVVASPLFLSNDLRHLSHAAETRRTLQNRGILSIAQDRLGYAGRRVRKDGNLQIWVRPIEPVGSYAVAIVNCAYRPPDVVLSKEEKEYVDQESHVFMVRFGELGLENEFGYNVTELFSSKYYGYVFAEDFSRFYVNRNDVQFYRFVALIESDLPVYSLRKRERLTAAFVAQVTLKLPLHQFTPLPHGPPLDFKPAPNFPLADEAEMPVGFTYLQLVALVGLGVGFFFLLLLRCFFPRKYRNCVARFRII